VITTTNASKACVNTPGFSNQVFENCQSALFVNLVCVSISECWIALALFRQASATCRWRCGSKFMTGPPGESRRDHYPDVLQVWDLLWTGEEAIKKGMPILKKAGFERV